MRSIVRVAALLLTVVATGYFLQAGDLSKASPPPRVLAISVELLNMVSPGSEREYFISTLRVIPTGRQTITLPILMYHYVRQPPSMRSDGLGYKLSVSPADFEQQMAWLSTHGYHPVDFNDVRAYFAGQAPLPAKPVVITFDDGYADLYAAAYPILVAHRFKAVAYVVSGFVGQPRYLTAGQVVEMDRNGIEIASHTVNHADLARSSSASTMHQLVDSKRWLEHLLGHSVLDFAYPSGQFNAQVVAAVQRAGYDTAVTTRSAIDHSVADRYTWARVRVGGGESLSEFVQNLGSPMPSISITALDLEIADAGQPSRARPTHPRPK